MPVPRDGEDREMGRIGRIDARYKMGKGMMDARYEMGKGMMDARYEMGRIGMHVTRWGKG